MTTNDHLDRAKVYIGIAESADAKIEAYGKAADEIIAARNENPQLSYRQIDEQIGKWKGFARELVAWRTDGDLNHLPFGGPERNETRYRNQKTKILRDTPQEELAEIVEQLPQEAKEKLAKAVNEGARREVYKDQKRRVDEKVAKAEKVGREEVPHLYHQEDYLEINIRLHKAGRNFAAALDKALATELSDQEREAVEETLDTEIVRVLDWFKSYLHSDSRDFDTELEELLKGK